MSMAPHSDFFAWTGVWYFRITMSTYWVTCPPIFGALLQCFVFLTVRYMPVCWSSIFQHFPTACYHVNGALFRFFCMDWGLIFSDNNDYILGNMPTNFRDPAAMFSIFNSNIRASFVQKSYAKSAIRYATVRFFLIEEWNYIYCMITLYQNFL